MALTYAVQAEAPCPVQYALASTASESVGVIVECSAKNAKLAAEDIVLSPDVAFSLGVTEGDSVNLLSPEGPDTPLGSFPVQKAFTVVSAPSSPVSPNTVVVSRAAFQELFGEAARQSNPRELASRIQCTNWLLSLDVSVWLMECLFRDLRLWNLHIITKSG
ncbi:hypothetical protein [Devosia sp. Leaf420]|uniref:hypothetical protein n=1 Tax=Devosia sp. Leaf420 TaxID=1736374 RepID=UPI0012E94EFC|nr:hypothetical protein [Devosia sp. Leaf420]